MTEIDLLTLARATTQNELSYFAQMITISFAMVVAVYYFLHQAGWTMKLFAFGAYLVGMLLFFGQMLMETNLKPAINAQLAALPHRGAVTERYLGLQGTWLVTMNSAVFTGAVWLLCAGVFYLVFFWKPVGEQR
jgi:hypothetical protein